MDSIFRLLLTSLLVQGALAGLVEYGLPPVPRNVEVLKYDIHVQPYFPDEAAEWDNNRTLTFGGFVRVSFRSVAFADHLSLDMHNLTILSVRLYQGERIIGSNHTMERETGRLKIIPEGRFIPPLNYAIEVAYTGDIVFGGQENGVIYGTYKNRRGNRSFMVYTQFEPQDARRLMPCWDDPHFKAVVQLTLTYPKGYTALSNTLPQTNYVSGRFCGGESRVEAGLFLRDVGASRGWEGMEGYLDYALRSTAGCIVAMKEYTQMDFGLPKLGTFAALAKNADVLAVPALNIGAMENWGLIISSHSAVYANPLLWGIASTQCHETVHQWLGDLVTADRWGDLFLHESFATYFETTMTKRFIPAEHHRFIDSKRVKQVGRGLNTADYIYHPLVYNQSDFRYVYQPGAAILNTVEWAIGEDAFRRALRRYLRQHRLGNAVYRDLANAFLEETQHVNFGACSSIVNLTHFLDAFFLQPSFPLIAVEHSASGNFISQEPYNRSNVKKNREPRSWGVPLLAVHADASYSRYWMIGNNACEEQPLPSELKFVLGRPYSPFARIRYDNETFEALMKAFSERPDLFDDNHLLRLFYDEFSFLVDNVSLDPLRLSRIMLNRLDRAAVDGKISSSVFLFIMGFAWVADEYIPPMEDARFRNLTIGALERLYKRVGWNVNSDRSWDERTLQSAVLFHAVYFEVKAAIEDAQHYLKHFLDECFFSGTHHNIGAWIMGDEHWFNRNAQLRGITYQQLYKILEKSDDEFDDFLRDLGLLKTFIFCGHCGGELAYRENIKVFRCRVKKCQKSVSPTSGSFFEGNHLPRKKVFELGYYWSRKNVAHDELQFQLKANGHQLGDHTVVDHKQFFRDICVEHLMGHEALIGGVGKIVEIDETALTKRKYHRGRLIKQTQWLFGGVERGSSENLFLVPVAKRDAVTLLPIIQQYIRPGTTIMSDCWAAYGGINQLPEGYEHLRVNHSINFVDPDNGAYTQTIETTWQKFKATHKSRYGTHRSLLVDYIQEFVWRKRYGGENAFYWLWEHVAAKYKVVNPAEEDSNDSDEENQPPVQHDLLEEGEIP